MHLNRPMHIVFALLLLGMVLAGCGTAPSITGATTTPASATLPAGPDPHSGTPAMDGKVILVSIGQQWLWAYADHQLVYRTAVTTGQPDLPTPPGTYPVVFHREDMLFTTYSPPEHVNYGLYFLDDGFYIHDAPWRQQFGPGTNLPHQGPDGTASTGSHGCVEVSTPAGAWLYQWAEDHTTMIVITAN